MGLGELVLTLLVAFVVIGPKRMPEVMQALGKYTLLLQRFSQRMRREFNKELNIAKGHSVRAATSQDEQHEQR